MTRIEQIVFAVLFGSALIGCSGAVEMTSLWNDNVVIIDGSNSEWGPALKPIADPPVAIGVRNDAEFLYVCLTTQNPVYQSQILNGGLTVWFDPTGEKDQTFGVRFPNHGENNPRWNPREPLTTAFPFLESSYRELAILGSEEQQELFSIIEVKGVKVKMGASENGLVFEMQVPLKTSPQFPHAVGVTGTNVIGVGFQTGEVVMDRLQGPSGRAAAGGRGRRGGRGAGGAGAPLDGAGRTEVLDLWSKVSLSSR